MNQQKEKSNKTENLSDVYGISLRLSAQAPTTRQPSQPPFHDHPFLVLGLVSLRCLAWTRLVTLHTTWLYMSPVRRWLRFLLVLRGRTLVLGLVSLRRLASTRLGPLHTPLPCRRPIPTSARPSPARRSPWFVL